MTIVILLFTSPLMCFMAQANQSHNPNHSQPEKLSLNHSEVIKIQQEVPGGTVVH